MKRYRWIAFIIGSLTLLAGAGTALARQGEARYLFATPIILTVFGLVVASLVFVSVLNREKERELTDLIERGNSSFKGDRYNAVLAKAHLTLQNNWRIAAGTINYQGVFPSYHYKGFHGFWSWDSWKHAVGLSYYNPLLAKDQIRAMYDYQSEDGFIVDCIYRDTTIEANNYRDTKPPLSAWAVAKITEKNEDIRILTESLFKDQHIDWGDSEDFYTIVGALPDYIKQVNPDAVTLCMPFEFGTMNSQTTIGSLQSIHRMILENQGFNNGFKNVTI